jgi:biopolymer transport protein ExbB
MRYRLYGSWIRVVALVAMVVVGGLPQAWGQPAATGTPQAAPSGAPRAAPTASPLGTLTPAQIEALRQERINDSGPKKDEAPAKKGDPEINIFQLAIDGGWLMIPILFGSVIVVCFSLERALGLRRRKLMPPPLVQELGELAKRQGGVDPRAAYRACMRYPSTASTVIKAVLLKIGRPFAELEATLKEVNEREAAKLYRNVRPIELQVSVAPLLGLLGTVQGMIMAFFQTANLGNAPNIAEKLAQGIYVALVTTFAGLCVAIPAAVLAHYFEGRIQALFRDLDEFVLAMLPQWERFEGKLRVSRQSLSGEPESAPAAEKHPEHHPAANPAANPERMPPPVPR